MKQIPDLLVYCLREELGLNIASVNPQALLNAVQLRMQAVNQSDANAYANYVQHDESERQHLIEAVVIPETSFFRHPAAFIALRRLALQRPQPKRLWRVLCLPSSTGEEPYSVAMCLLEAGLSPDSFTVDAVDVSQQSLLAAQRGIYPQYSFRGEMVHRYMSYFTAVEEGYELASNVRQCVRFHQGNILDHHTLAQLGQYPVIFCRNLLIYLHAQARKKAARNIAKMLEAKGTLFAGNAENSQVWQGEFSSRRIPMAFALKHTCQEDTAQHLPLYHQPLKATSKQKSTLTQVKAATSLAKVETCTLKHIAEAINQEQPKKVHDLCQQYLQQHSPCAEVYFYHALAYEGEGDLLSAITALRQAVYLQPDFVDALQRLLLLLERQGEALAAERVRRRLNKLDRASHGI